MRIFYSVYRNDKGQVIREYTPETRLAEHAELEEMRRGEKKQEVSATSHVASLNFPFIYVL